MNHTNKYEVISKIVSKEWTKVRGSIALNCSMRYINILINKYKQRNKTCFIHDNTGHIPVNKLTRELIGKILQLKKNIRNAFHSLTSEIKFKPPKILMYLYLRWKEFFDLIVSSLVSQEKIRLNNFSVKKCWKIKLNWHLANKKK
jgi:hypothetical protein